jgi:hypothetical protein
MLPRLMLVENSGAGQRRGDVGRHNVTDHPHGGATAERVNT